MDSTDTKTAAPIQVILNLKTGDVDQVGGVGVGDEVWFNTGDSNYYTASSTSPSARCERPEGGPCRSSAAILGVIDAKDEEVLQLVPTIMCRGRPAKVLIPPGPRIRSPLMPRTIDIFVPLAANNVFPNCLTGCIAVYWHGDEDEPGQAALP